MVRIGGRDAGAIARKRHAAMSGAPPEHKYTVFFNAEGRGERDCGDEPTQEELKTIAANVSGCMCSLGMTNNEVKKIRESHFVHLEVADGEHVFNSVVSKSMTRYGAFKCFGYATATRQHKQEEEGPYNVTKYSVYREHSDGTGRVIVMVANEKPAGDHTCKKRLDAEPKKKTLMVPAQCFGPGLTVEAMLAAGLTEAEDMGLYLTGKLHVGDGDSEPSSDDVMACTRRVAFSLGASSKSHYLLKRGITPKHEAVKYLCAFGGEPNPVVSTGGTFFFFTRLN